jgi:uncharacterized protein YutD
MYHCRTAWGNLATVIRVENWLFNEIQSLFDKQDINIRFNDNVLIVYDYLCWLAVLRG